MQSRYSWQIYKSIKSQLVGNSGSVTAPGIAQLVAKHREDDVKLVDNFTFVNDVVSLKDRVNAMVSVSNRISPVLGPISCTLDEIVALVSGNSGRVITPSESFGESAIISKVYEILDLLIPDLGIMLLVDLYSILNKCNLGYISPKQVYNLAESIGRGYKRVELYMNKSKIVAIVNKLSEKNVLQGLKNIKEFAAGVSPAQYASIGNISTILAEYHLMLGETKGILLRDQSLQGIKYFVWPKI